MRKSRREKEQEVAEAKQREEEANAAKAYAEFLDAFEGEDVAKRRPGGNFVKSSVESGAAYVPSIQAHQEPQPRRTRPSETEFSRQVCFFKFWW